MGGRAVAPAAQVVTQVGAQLLADVAERADLGRLERVNHQMPDGGHVPRGSGDHLLPARRGQDRVRVATVVRVGFAPDESTLLQSFDYVGQP